MYLLSIQLLFSQEQNENLLLSPAQYNSVVNASLPNCHSSSFLRTSRYASKFSSCKSNHQAPVIDSDNNIIGSKLLKPRPLRISKYVSANPCRLGFTLFELKMDVFLCFELFDLCTLSCFLYVCFILALWTCFRRQNQSPPNYKCHPPRKPHSKRHHIANGSQASKVLPEVCSYCLGIIVIIVIIIINTHYCRQKQFQAVQ